jgi:hypothetical protein
VQWVGSSHSKATEASRLDRLTDLLGFYQFLQIACTSVDLIKYSVNLFGAEPTWGTLATAFIDKKPG